MPAVSQQQQKLMALALAYKRGEAKDVSAKVKEIADSMSEKDLEDFASTKHKGLPMKKEELIKEGLSVLKEQTYSRDMFGVTGEPARLKRQASGAEELTNRDMIRNTARQTADLSKRQSRSRLQRAALDDTRTFPARGDAFWGTTSMQNTLLKNKDSYSKSELGTIRKYYDNAITNIKDHPLGNMEYNRKYNNIDTGEYGTLRPAMDASRAERLANPNLPSPSEDSVLGSFADRFAASGSRSKYSGSGSSRRGSRGNRPTTPATSQNFLKNVDPKLAAGIAAGTLGAAGLAAFVANRRRKKKRG